MQFKPDAIVYLGQMPSAPYSMKGVEEAIYTQHDNILGNLTTLWAMKEVCPDAHLLKLGTMGEYGTPDCEIPEGKFPSGASWFNQNTEHVGNLGGMTFPRQAGSWYHQSKVHDTHNVEMACRIWGLRSTDVMQGIVYGTHIDEMEEDPDLRTRFDFDECFGTVIHRFCSQAVAELSLTVYGSGKQIRGFLPLKDSIHCLELALENPPEFGEYRVFNQLAYSQSIARVAIQVRDAALSVGIQATIGQTGNPRVESETHKYAVSCNNLKYLGYTPSYDLPTDLQAMMTKLKPYKSRILAYRSAIDPKTTWK
jgi:UDP-sulfoquinovose synthase